MSVRRYPIRPGQGESGPLDDLDTTGAAVGQVVAVAQVSPLEFRLSDPGAELASLAQRVLAQAMRPAEAFELHPDPPTVTLSTVNAATSISGGVLIVPRRHDTELLINTVGDPHFEYPGIPDGAMDISAGTRARPALLTGGAAQAARHRPRFRFHYSGTVLEAHFRQLTTSFVYRIWVDGYPLTDDMVTAVVEATGTYLLKLTFAAPSSHLIEFEVADPQFGGVWIEPTASITRSTTARPTLMGFGDSITAGALGVSPYNTWLRYAAQIMGCDWINTSIGGAGYLTGAPTADFRTRLTPDVVSQAPDVLVVFGSYNDSNTATETEIRDEADYLFGQIATQLPGTLVIAVGCWQPAAASTAPATFLNADAGVKAAAALHNVPFISLCDPTDSRATAAAWAPATGYTVGDSVLAQGWIWKCVTGHTSGGSFAVTNWRPTTFITGTGRSGATAGDGNADLFIGADGVHPTAAGHRALGWHLAQEITRALRVIAAG